jgi:hypothetical protein
LQGRVEKSFKPYCLKFLLPFLICIFLWEDTTNVLSPRRGWYKAQLSMPDMRDYLMFEIGVVFEKQDKNKKVKQNSGKDLTEVLDDN